MFSAGQSLHLPGTARGARVGGILLVALGMVASACGSSSPAGNGVAALGPTAIIAKARSAVDSAPTLRMVGQVSQSGQDIGFDISFKSGVGSVGTLTLSGATINLILDGQTIYLKGDQKFWSQIGAQGTGGQASSSALVALFAGKWLRIDKSASGTQFPGYSQIVSFAQPHSLTDQVFSSSNTQGVTKVGTTTFDGQSAVKLTDTSGGDLYVATTGPPYPLEVTSGTKSGSTGSINFTYGVPVTVSAPPGAVNISSLVPKGTG